MGNYLRGEHTCIFCEEMGVNRFIYHLLDPTILLVLVLVLVLANILSFFTIKMMMMMIMMMSNKKSSVVLRRGKVLGDLLVRVLGVLGGEV